MYEILRSLTPGKRVLDLGSRSGSFSTDACPDTLVIRLDLAPSTNDRDAVLVQADAAFLPFASHCFDVVIANHSLEHMADLTRVLSEMGRVLSSRGSMYVSVPDSTTLSDRLYRWVYHGGGHVNPFGSLAELNDRITMHVPLEINGSRMLHSSFGFLTRKHFHPRPPRRMWLLGNGQYAAVAILSYVARLLDRVFHTRLSVYGWAIYYGNNFAPIVSTAWTNVCIECGSAYPADSLRPRRLAAFVMVYTCPLCKAWNLFSRDQR